MLTNAAALHLAVVAWGWGGCDITESIAAWINIILQLNLFVYWSMICCYCRPSNRCMLAFLLDFSTRISSNSRTKNLAWSCLVWSWKPCWLLLFLYSVCKHVRKCLYVVDRRKQYKSLHQDDRPHPKTETHSTHQVFCDSYDHWYRRSFC